MGPAKLLSAFVGLGVVLLAGAQSTNARSCGPCTKMYMPVCGVNGDGEAWTFPNSCMLRWCNCMLQTDTDSDKYFKEVKPDQCEGLQSNETEVPECFQETEATSEWPDGEATARTLDLTEAPAAAAAHHGPAALLAATAAVAVTALLATGGV